MRLIIFLAAYFLTSTAIMAGTMVLEGKYQGKNLYVVNSVSGSGVGYCVFEVQVNGKVSSDEWNSPAFEIDLGVFGLGIGDDVIVTIKYKEGCVPKVINPGVLEPQPSFEIASISISESGLMEWETTGETGQLPFIIQQFKWNKWVSVGEVIGKGTSGKNKYSFQTVEVSGVNKFRVAQKSSEGDSRTSEAVEYKSSKPAVTVVYDKRTKKLKFSEDTNYELYNMYGQIVKRGFGSEADLSDLPKAEYYINYDNSSERFFRK